jgi:hypothetical protein
VDDAAGQYYYLSRTASAMQENVAPAGPKYLNPNEIDQFNYGIA